MNIYIVIFIYIFYLYAYTNKQKLKNKQIKIWFTFKQRPPVSHSYIISILFVYIKKSLLTHKHHIFIFLLI